MDIMLNLISLTPKISAEVLMQKRLVVLQRSNRGKSDVKFVIKD